MSANMLEENQLFGNIYGKIKNQKTTETAEAPVQKSTKCQKQNGQIEPFNKNHVSKRAWKDQSISSI